MLNEVIYTIDSVERGSSMNFDTVPRFHTMMRDIPSDLSDQTIGLVITAHERRKYLIWTRDALQHTR